MRRLLPALCGTALALAMAPAHAAGNAENGKLLTYTCAGCHGIPEYRNAYPSYHVPKIAGQNEAYLANALKAYKSGDRTRRWSPRPPASRTRTSPTSPRTSRRRRPSKRTAAP